MLVPTSNYNKLVEHCNYNENWFLIFRLPFISFLRSLEKVEFKYVGSPSVFE